MATDKQGLIGYVLGECQLERLIGQGGMSSVYLGRQTRPARYVAVKVLVAPPGTYGEGYETFLTRFRREADIVAKLEHINIIPLYAYGEENQFAYIIMPYIGGGSLSDLINKQGRLTPQKTLVYLQQAAAALDYAHTRNVVHRDLKPSNFLLYPDDDRLVLADFGIARITTPNPYATQETTLTQAGSMPGTLAYMAPEMLRDGQNIDYRVDIYALGIVLYQMLSGELPFKGDMYTLINQHLSQSLPRLNSRDPAIPASIDDVLHKATAKDREERYASGSDLVRGFRIAIGGISTGVPSSVSALDNAFTTPSAGRQTPFPGWNPSAPSQSSNRPAGTGSEAPRPATTRDNPMGVPQRDIYPAAPWNSPASTPPPASQMYGAYGAYGEGRPLDATMANTPAYQPPQNYRPATSISRDNPPQTAPGDRPPSSSLPAQKHRPRRAGILFLILAIVLIAGLVGLWSLHRSSTPPPPATPIVAAEQVIQEYYNDVNKHDYKAAYSLLTPEFQSYLNYDSFVQGYGNTRHDDISFGNAVQLSINNVEVPTTISALENRPQGSVTSTYHIRYRVVHRSNGWKIMSGVVA
ncbi:MAG: hypothetical protein NVS2B12_27590 [Ktedonobacteraceae bacterium]